MPALYTFEDDDDEPKRSPEEIKAEIKKMAKEAKEIYDKMLLDGAEVRAWLDKLEKDPECWEKEDSDEEC
jgi:hypothetical protein